MTVFACFGVVCVSLLVGLVLVLRHLSAMRLTSGEVAQVNGRVDLLVENLKQTNEKLTILNNRAR